jgi:hypothetical protein
MELWDHRAQEFEALADKIELLDRYSGDIAPRMGRILHQAVADRIECHGKDNRNGRRRLF